MDSRFQVDLRGIINLLARNIYESPQVFLRELLQNAVDALRARGYLEPGFQGEVNIEIMGDPPVLVVSDNGIGLSEAEIHQFLATIGSSSKSGELWDQPVDFLGRFGIGLLSCFVVSEEIVVITRSARGDSPAMEWRGRSDGTYTVRPVEREVAPGTRVFLTARADARDRFRADAVRESAENYGVLLPYPITVTVGGRQVRINGEPPVWRQKFATSGERTQALLEYGSAVFKTEFFDAVPIRVEAGGIDGVAYILAGSVAPTVRQAHRIYLKGMLLAESAGELLPEWAFFVRCILNVESLEPTASRESFRQDENLEEAREALGQAIRDHLAAMARRDPDRLQRLLAVHGLAIKALAVEDDEFFGMVADWIPFETSLGEMTLGEYRRQHEVIRYAPRLEQFRQIAPIAAAQSLCVLNAAYTYCAELIEKLPSIFPRIVLEQVDAEALVQRLDEPTLEERDEVFDFVRLADRVLQPLRCVAEVRKFRPSELPALYSTGPEFEYLRSLEGAKEESNPLFSSVLDGVAEQLRESGAPLYARLCFNYENPLIRKLCRLRDRDLLQRAIRVLYVQSLLLGHRPLNVEEMKLLGRGLLELIEMCADARASTQ